MPADDVTKTPVPQAITTPSRVEAGIGALEFPDGYPTVETAATLRDHLDYLHGGGGAHHLRHPGDARARGRARVPRGHLLASPDLRVLHAAVSPQAGLRLTPSFTNTLKERAI